MKTTVKPLSKVKGLGDIETPENNPQLKHYLSPLELAAYKHSFQSFTYRIEGETLHIEAHVAKEIYFNSKKHVGILRSILQRCRQKELKQNIKTKRFLNAPLKDHGLPTRIYHVLRQNDCENMADVANRGEYGLKRMRGMGKESINYLIKLFIDNGCGNLFL
jgi:DNA-directed RNA polymerase alpha subunit